MEVHAKDSIDSYGSLILRKSEYTEPKVSATTNLKVNESKSPLTNLTDWNRSTTFTSVEAPKDGDYITFELKEPTFISRLEVRTGIPQTMPCLDLDSGFVLPVEAVAPALDTFCCPVRTSFS